MSSEGRSTLVDTNKLKKRRNILFSLFGAAVVAAILLLTMNIYQRSSVMDSLFSAYRSLSSQMSSVQQSEQVTLADTSAIDALSVQVASLEQAANVQVVAGPAGANGVQGVDGVDGANGNDGVNGTQGSQGLQGIQGLQGVQGIQGIQGPQGSPGTATCANGACVSLQVTPSVQETGYIYVDTVQATNLVGDGSGITSLNAAQLTGTISNSLLSSSVTLQGNTFNGNSQLVQTTLGGALPSLSGANLTALNASNLSSGTLSDSRLSSNVTLQGNIFNGISQLVQTNSSGELPVLSGLNLTNLNAGSLNSGTVSDSRLSSNVTLQGNSFNGNSQLVQTTVAGALPVISGVNLTNLNAASITSGSLADARLSGNVTIQGNSFNGSSQLVQTTSGGALPALSGVNLTNLSAGAVASGTLSDSRLSSNVTLQGNTFNGASQLVQLDGSGALPAISGANLTNLPSGSCPSCVQLQASTPGSFQTGHLNISGTAIAGAFSGSGAALTSLNASNVSSGTLADARLSSNITAQGNVFNGNSQLVQTTGAGVLPVISGANLTNLNASNIASGTLSNSVLSTSVTVQGNNFNAAGQLVQLNGSAQLPAVSGALLTNLNGSNISTGTISNSRLTTNVTVQGNTFNGASQLVQLDAGGLLPALNGSALTNLSASQISSGTLADARLSSNVALLNRDSQTFTGTGTIFRNGTNSANSFSVQNSSSSNVLNVDTTASQVQMTNATASSSLTVGSSGSVISQIRYYAPTLNPSNVPAASTSEQTFTVNGLTTDDTVIVNKPSLTNGCGMIGARVSAANTLAISWVNVLGILGCDPPSEVYKVMAFRSS